MGLEMTLSLGLRTNIDRHRYYKAYIHLVALLTSSLLSIALVTGMDLYNVRFSEHHGSRLVATSNSNYAVLSPKLLSKDWRCVSVNGDRVMIVSPTGDIATKSLAQLDDDDKSLLEEVRDEVARSNSGFNHIASSSVSGSSSLGGETVIQTSSSGNGQSSSFSSSTSGPEQFNSPAAMSVNMRDENNFSVAKQDFPFNWSRLFFNDDLVAMVYRNGDVEMIPLVSALPKQISALNRIKEEAKVVQAATSQQFSNTMRQSMDMVSNIFNSIMGQFPQAPNYQTSIGNTFGNNFPFGPNNSPFSAAAGWPFGSGNGAFAGAFAG